MSDLDIAAELRALAQRVGARMDKRKDSRDLRTIDEVIADHKAKPAPVASDRILATVAGRPPRRIELEPADDDLEF